jgi:hypothetical protein
MRCAFYESERETRYANEQETARAHSETSTLLGININKFRSGEQGEVVERWPPHSIDLMNNASGLGRSHHANAPPPPPPLATQIYIYKCIDAWFRNKIICVRRRPFVFFRSAHLN